MKKSRCKKGIYHTDMTVPLFGSIFLIIIAAGLFSTTAVNPLAVTNGIKTLQINQSFDFSTGTVYSYPASGWTSYLGFLRPPQGSDVLGDPDLPNGWKTIIYINYSVPDLVNLPGCPTYANATDLNYRQNSGGSKLNYTGNSNLAVGDVYCVYTETQKYAKIKIAGYNAGVNVTFDWTYQDSGSQEFGNQTPPGCGAITNSLVCIANQSCEWINNMCVMRIQNPCINFTTQDLCNQNPDTCFWDSTKGECKPGGGGQVNCTLYSNTSDTQCMMNMQCQWNSTSNVCSLSPCASNCSVCDQGHCPNNPLGCWWDFGMSVCKPGGGGPGMPTCDTGDCFMCLNESDCNTLPKPENNFCAWMLDPGMNTYRCQMNTTCAQDCFRCKNPTECLASNETLFANHTGACSWDTTQLSCYPAGMGPGGGGSPCQNNCTLCGDQFACYGSPAKCKWNESSPIKCTTSPCSTNCSTCGNSNDCQWSPLSCVWNPINITCGGRSCDNDCTSCGSQTACNTRTPICEWSTSGLCNYNLSSSFGNQLACNSNCTLCSSDSICWGSQIGCEWDYGQVQFPCRKSNCNLDCRQCSGSTNCQLSKFPGGCHWDAQFGIDNRTGQYYGECVANGYGQSCNDDCFMCSGSDQCNASANLKFGGQGCNFEVDPVTNWSKCVPRGFVMDCEHVCEACNQTQCLARNVSSGPGTPSCEWKSSENKCRPQGYVNFGGGGGFFPCPSLDFTDRATCEVHSDCRWESSMSKCLIKESVLGCSGMCSMCINQTQCQGNPKCVWDTPPGQTGFCRENFEGGGFFYGGNCQGNCFDCHTSTDCNSSSAPSGCRWVTDSFGGTHCDMANMMTCEEECFACMMQAECLASNNSRGYSKAYGICTNLTNLADCNAEQPYCNWTGSACVSRVPNACEWNPTYMYCKPANFTQEICFAPGDEDGNGLEGCADHAACDDDPFCKFSPTGGGGEGPMGTGVPCFQWDQQNGGSQSICENYTNGTATGCVWKIVMKPPFMNETMGVCEPKFNDFVFQGMQEGPPNMIFHDFCKRDLNDPEVNVSDWADICDIGIKDMENTVGFVMQLYSIQDLALCNSVFSNSNNRGGRYYFFLDTDANASSGCHIDVNITETDRPEANFVFGEGGLEYKLEYIVSYNPTTGNVTETRTAYRCINGTTGSWGILQATITGKKDEACMHQGIYLGILKSDINNPTGKIRIIALTSNASSDVYDNSTQVYYPVDRAGPAWYKPGTIDFHPPDCINNPTACGSGFDVGGGFMRFEDCMPGSGDEDFDGQLNCGDSDCFNDMRCAGNTTYVPENDTEAPTVTSSNVDVHSDFAMVFWTTNELATGIVSFYGTNGTCQSNPQNISQPYDSFFPQSRYTPFHGVPLDPRNPRISDRVTLSQSTTYYYKTISCDQARVNVSGTIQPNCGVSACLNFTTTQDCNSITNQTVCQLSSVCRWDNTTTPARCKPGFVFAFNFIPPTTNPRDPLGGLNIMIDRGNGFEVFNPNDVAYINCSTNSTLRFTNPNTTINNVTLPWSIDLIGCEVCTAASINLTSTLFAGNNTNGTLYLGLDSQRWYQLAQSFSCDNVYLNLPGVNLSCDSIGLSKCGNNGTSCAGVSGDNATMISCNSTLNMSVWKLPASSGIFSTYTLSGSDLSPPVITSISVSTTNVSATVTWTTNENSNSTVNYGMDVSNLDLYAYNQTGTNMSTSHMVVITGLTVNTTYYYSLISSDASGNTRTDTNSGSYYHFMPSTSTIELISLISGWNLISLPLVV